MSRALNGAFWKIARRLYLKIRLFLLKRITEIRTCKGCLDSPPAGGFSMKLQPQRASITIASSGGVALPSQIRIPEYADAGRVPRNSKLRREGTLRTLIANC